MITTNKDTYTPPIGAKKIKPHKELRKRLVKALQSLPRKGEWNSEDIIIKLNRGDI